MRDQAKPSILIVDDDQAILAVLREICESMGCEVTVAENGLKALEWIDLKPFTVVISDVRMPHMNGVSLLDAIEEKGIDLPVIIMSGFSDYGPEEIDAHNGVVLLEKPFSKEQIQETIESYVKLLPERQWVQ